MLKAFLFFSENFVKVNNKNRPSEFLPKAKQLQLKKKKEEERVPYKKVRSIKKRSLSECEKNIRTQISIRIEMKGRR